MKNKLSNILTTILDAGEWMLHTTTMIGAVVLVIYSVIQTITDPNLSVFIPILMAGLLLVINIAMRIREASKRGGGSKV